MLSESVIVSLDAHQAERARRLHRESLILLAHDHFPPPEDLEALQRGGVTAKILMGALDARAWSNETEDYQRSTVEIDGWHDAALKTIREILSNIGSCPQLCVVRTVDDILQAKRNGRVGILLGAEGGKLIGYELGNLHCLYELGLRHVMLTWAFNNQLSTAELDSSGRGLTDFGRDVVAEMNRLGMIIDVTHLSRPAMREVIELSTGPVLNSHTTLKSLANRVPSLTAEEIRLLADRNGVIGVHFMTHMLTGRFAPQALLDDLLRQIGAIANIGGIDCVALGPDYLPYTENFRRNTGQSSLSFPVGLQDAGGLPLLTSGLVQRGHSDEAIQKILGGNLLRLFRETIG